MKKTAKRSGWAALVILFAELAREGLCIGAPQYCPLATLGAPIVESVVDRIDAATRDEATNDDPAALTTDEVPAP